MWHIAWNDLRRLQVPLLLWAVVITAKLGIGVLLIFGVGGYFDPLFAATNSLAALEVLAGYFLVPALVHGDVLVGSRSFWMTRPISGTRLFAGKLAALAVVFGVVPVVLHLPWWLACGYGGREGILAVTEVLLEQGAVVALALAIATPTDGLPRFLFWTLILLTVEIFAVATFGATPEMGALVVLSVILAGGVVSAAIHFIRRRLLISVILVGAVGFYGVGLSWAIVTLPFGAGSAKPTTPAGSHANEIFLSLHGTEAERWDSKTARLDVGLRAENLPPGFILEGEASHRWVWAGGATLQRTGRVSPGTMDSAWFALGVKPPEDNSKLRTAIDQRRSERGMPTPAEPLRKPFEILQNGVLVPAAFPNRVRRDPPGYLLRADLRLMRPVVMGEAPAQAGNVIANSGERTRVVATSMRYFLPRASRAGAPSSWMGGKAPLDPTTRKPLAVPQQLRVTLTEYRCTVPGSDEGQAGIGPFLFTWARRTYFLVNRQRGEAVSDSNSSVREYDSFRTRGVRVGTVGIVWRWLEFTGLSEYSTAEGRWVPTPGWFEGATLAKLRLQEEESFTKELRVERFQLLPNRSNGGTP